MNPLRIPQEHIDEIANKLAIPTIQVYGRHEIWLLMKHIEALEAEIKRQEKSADFLQDAVIRVLTKKPTIWQKIKKWRVK